MSKFDELSRLYPKEKQRLDAMEKAEKHARILVDLKEHEGMKFLINELVQKVQLINEELLSSKSITEVRRECLLTDRERCEWFLNILPKAERTIKIIEEKLNKAYDKKRITS